MANPPKKLLPYEKEILSAIRQREAEPNCRHCGKPKAEMARKLCGVGGCPEGNDL